MKIICCKGRTAPIVVHFGAHYGFSVKRVPDAEGRYYLTFVIWYRAAPDRLGYLYPALRWL
jgi:hypothetical protein